MSNQISAVSFGELVQKVREIYGMDQSEACAYLVAAFFSIAKDEDVNRIYNSLGVVRK